MAVHGSLAPFNPKEEDWEYTDRLSYYFTANGITDNAKKRAILISCYGPAAFCLMKTLAFPDQTLLSHSWWKKLKCIENLKRLLSRDVFNLTPGPAPWMSRSLTM